MYIVREVFGTMCRVIGKNNKPIEPDNFELDNVKYFKTRKDATAWIRKHTYEGMSYHYELMGVPEERK